APCPCRGRSRPCARGPPAACGRRPRSRTARRPPRGTSSPPPGCRACPTCPYLGRQVLPRVGLLLGRLDVVEDVVEVDPRQVAAPRRHRAGEEVVERAVPELAHPVRLALVRRDRVDELVREA